MNEQETNSLDKNPDPITGEPGSHPVGTGLGTAGAGAAGAAIGGVVGGPVGAIIGAVAGGIAGAYGGKGVAESMNPTVEEAYWRENHTTQSFATAGSSYNEYAPAYRTGYEGFAKHSGKNFDDIEDDLALDYERNRADSALPWDEARHASRAAWMKVSGTVTPTDVTRGTRGSL